MTGFRLTGEPLETPLHEVVAQALNVMVLPPAFWCHYPAGSILLTPAQAAKLNRLGLKRGIPDLMIFHGGIWGIELKRVGGHLSRTRTVRTRRGALRVLEGQADVHPRLLAAGWMGIAVCTSLEAVLAQLTVWGVPLRRYS